MATSAGQNQYIVKLKESIDGFDVSIVDREISFSGAIKLRDLSIPVRLQKHTPMLAADMVDIGCAVQVADRLCLRGRRSQNCRYGYWERQIAIDIPVRCPDMWSRKPIKDKLAEALGFLTDDRWDVNFSDRRRFDNAGIDAIPLQLFPKAEATNPAVMLFSGGIDSLFGLYQLLGGAHDIMFPVTVTNNHRVNDRRSEVLAAIPFNLIPVSTSLRMEDVKGVSKEDSARARVAQSIFAGVAFAVACSADRLYVTENGMGAISLPMTSDHFGSTATKATHPHTLALFSELIGLVTGRHFEIVNLGLQHTKGEMISALVTEPWSRKALNLTSTCDRKPHRGLTTGCGVCTSCILRYAAFRAAGIIDAIQYGIEPSFAPSPVNRAGVAVEFQAERLAAIIASDNSMRALESAFSGIQGARPYLPSEPEFVSLVDRYVTETMMLASDQTRSRHAA